VVILQFVVRILASFAVGISKLCAGNHQLFLDFSDVFMAYQEVTDPLDF
jgi:hypothetical protein